MRNLIVTTAVLLLALGIAVAQQPAATDTSSQTAANAEQKSIRGCVGGSEGNFTLLDESGITYKLQGLADDKLKEHVGHTVEISGSVSSGAASSTTGAGAEQTLMISDIRMISEKCDVKTTEPSGAAAGAAPSDQGAQQPPASSTDMSASAQGSTTTDTTTQAQPGTTSDMSQQQAGSQPVSPDTSAQAGAEAGVTAQQPATEPAIPPAQEQQPPVAEEQQPAQQEAPPAAAAESGQQESETAAGQLPQTASPLPLLAVLGLGSLAAGLVSRRKK
jgi:LPXTG-motif cell wall-anchored protein